MIILAKLNSKTRTKIEKIEKVIFLVFTKSIKKNPVKDTRKVSRDIITITQR